GLEHGTGLLGGRVPVRCMGTAPAGDFRGDVPVTRSLTKEEVQCDYEKNTGLVIIVALRREGLSCDEMAAVLVANHGPFAWGKDAASAIEHAQVLEYLARVEWRVRALAAEAARPDSFLVDKHYLRKHGPDAYYGQEAPGLKPRPTSE